MLHHHTALGKVLCFVSSLLVSLAAIAIGLLAFNIDVLNLPFVQAHFASFLMPLEIAIGVAGLLALFFTLFGGMVEDKCEKKHDAHNKHHHSHD